MLTKPKLETRVEQPYMGIRTQAAAQELSTVIPQLIAEVFSWLGKQGVPPTGAPLVRYYITDMEKKLDIEMGVPVAKALAGDGRVKPNVIPAGPYATAIHTGHYDKLYEATRQFVEWAEQNGVVWQTSRVGGDEVFGGRFEFYPTDPQQVVNPDEWVTELAFLVNDK